jgi:hypothetical protein
VGNGARVSGDSFLIYRCYSNTVQTICSEVLINNKVAEREGALDGLLSAASAAAGGQPSVEETQTTPMVIGTPAEYLGAALSRVLDGFDERVSDTAERNQAAHIGHSERLLQLQSCLEGHSLPVSLRK